MMKANSRVKLGSIALSFILIVAVNSLTIDAKRTRDTGRHRHRHHGSNTGHNTGHSSGHSSGHHSTHNTGHDTSHKSSHNSGHSSGHTSEHGSEHAPTHTSAHDLSQHSGFSTNHNSAHTSGHNSVGVEHSLSSSSNNLGSVQPNNIGSGLPPHNSGAPDYGWKPPSSNSNNDFSAPHSGLSSGQQIHHVPLSNNRHQVTAPTQPWNTNHQTSYHPAVPAGAVYYPTAQSIPPGAIYIAQPPVSSSSRSSFDEGYLLGALSQSSRNSHRHHSASSSSSAPQENKAIPAPTGTASVPGGNGAVVPTGTPVGAVPVQENPYGIICVPMKTSKPDPRDSTKTIEVEEVTCYPAPPPTLPVQTTTVGQQPQNTMF